MAFSFGRFDLQGFEVDAGWRPLCEPIIKAARRDGVYVLAIYEDSGVLHVDVSQYTPGVESAIRHASFLARHTCELCGHDGRYRELPRGCGVRCDTCADS